MPADDLPSVKRAVGIAQKLANAGPLPVDRICVTSSFHYRKSLGMTAPDSTVLTFGRCGKGTTPPSGYIHLDDTYLTRLSDEGLAAIIAHAMASIEGGRKSGSTFFEEQWRVDNRVLARLHAAGYCAGEAMRKAGKEMIEVEGPRFGTYGQHPWLDHSPDCGPKNK